MGFKTDTFSWDMPWRENFEMRSAALWWASAAFCPPFMYLSNLPHRPFYWTAGLCVSMAVWRSVLAFIQWRKIHFLYLTPLTFITAKKLKKKVLSHPDEQWIGRGFIWEQKQAQYIYQLLQTDFIKSLNDPREDDKQGTGIIHGVGMGDSDQYQPLKHIEGHTLIVGLPGTGKTRLFDLLVSQCIMRGESVIIIDPKSDKDLRENARKACKEIGHPEKFVYFHPAFPNESVAIDPLKNFNRPTELASRIAALMPAGGLERILQSLLLESGRRYLPGNAHLLSEADLKAYPPLHRVGRGRTAHSNRRSLYQLGADHRPGRPKPIYFRVCRDGKRRRSRLHPP